MAQECKCIKKRDGRLVTFDEKKIAEAIWLAAQSQGGTDRDTASKLAGVVRDKVRERFFTQNITPGIEDVQDLVEKILIECGHAKTAKSYILYREKRMQVRSTLQIRGSKKVMQSETTDLALMVDTRSGGEIERWDKVKIVKALVEESGMETSLAEDIASGIERRVFNSGLSKISTTLIRELVDNELFERGLNVSLKRQNILGMPKFDLENLIFAKSKENANISTNNPEAVNLAIAENALKQYALQEIFSTDIADAHQTGKIHLHDLGYPTRVYCSSHSLEYIKKYGLKLNTLDTSSSPAKHSRTLTGHLNTFLASMQAYYAGALGVAYINIFYAPLVENLSDKELKQEAQYLIFSSSQSSFSRGGQTLFLDFNIHTGVPNYMKNVPVVGPGGTYNGKVYGDYEKVAQRFCRALLDVWRDGDEMKHPFVFPKCDFHVTAESFTDPDQRALLEHACTIASENGSIYFIFDRNEVTLSACCRLRTTIDNKHMLEHPESMRFCGFQNITINLPQAAYRAGKGNIEGFRKEIDAMIDIALKAHLQKKAFCKKLMSDPSMPLWQIGSTALDGRPYVDLDECTYIFGLIGLNEAIYHLTGKELHESDAELKLGLKIVSEMNLRLKKEGRRLKMKLALEESPAESASRRLAKIDLKRFECAKDCVRGSIEDDECYYTNSIHLRADANVDMLTRIRKQAKFHSLIDSGAMIHAFVGEQRPPAASIFRLVEKTFYGTQAAQLTISPEFTVCRDCKKLMPQILTHCDSCFSANVSGFSRIVGYYSMINNWNKSKLGELKDRRKGDYKV